MRCPRLTRFPLLQDSAAAWWLPPASSFIGNPLQPARGLWNPSGPSGSNFPAAGYPSYGNPYASSYYPAYPAYPAPGVPAGYSNHFSMYPSSYQRFRDADGVAESGEAGAGGEEPPMRFADGEMGSGAEAESGSLNGVDAEQSTEAAALRSGHFSAYRLAQRQHVLSLMHEEGTKAPTGEHGGAASETTQAAEAA